MTKIKDIINYLETIAPLGYQENYDNAGLITGNKSKEVTGILLCLDALENVIEEAIQKNCNLVIAHHPIVFKGLKKINGNNYVERTIIKAIKNDIAIYASHTNLDNVLLGVNRKIADKIGLANLKILAPKAGTLQKLVTFIPEKNTSEVLSALHEAGAGQIGNYQNCSFRVAGTGTFEPNEAANPHIGKNNQLEEVSENRIEVIFPATLGTAILQALKIAHPYEEVAYYLQNIENENQEVGAGMIGNLEAPMAAQDFMDFLKDRMQLACIRHTKITGKKIARVAVCGGAGSFLLPKALKAGADAYISADFKYHEFFDAENKLVIMDIGHYESEVFTKELIYEILSKKFTNIAVNFTEQVTNPISYY